MTEKMDELEFATKEDLEAINADERLKRVYNAMLAGVNKKFQSWAEERKKLSETLAAYEDILRQWEQWRPVIENYSQGYTAVEPPEEEEQLFKGRKTKQKETYDNDWQAELQAFRDEIYRAAQGFQKELETMRRMFDLSLQLDDLRREHAKKYPDLELDAKKIIDTAISKGYPDLENAYMAAYRDEFIKREVEQQLKSRLEEEKAKLRAPSETGSPSPTYFEAPKEAPKSFAEATKQVLEELRSGKLAKE